MGLFDSAKDLLNSAKDAATDALGEEGMDSLKNLKDSAVKAGSQMKKAAIDTWNTSDNETIRKAREFTAGARKAVQNNAGTTTEVRVRSGNGDGPGLVPAVCTQCGAALTVDPLKEAAVCQYCGTAFVVSKAIEQYNINHAEIHADKVEVHTKSKTEATLDYLQERQKARAEERRRKEEESRKRAMKMLPFLAGMIVVIFISLFVMDNKQKKETAAEELALQQTVEEVQALIDEGRYDEALVKANGVVFTTSTGTTKRKWDNTREALLDTIESKKEEAKKLEAEAAAAVEKAEAEVEEAVAPSAAPKQEKAKDTSKSVSYSTNSSSTVKAGNKGVYSYKSRGGSYSIYYIIDFDEGYVYRFLEGNGESDCDRVKIDSGDLNHVVVITYHVGGDKWSNALHFKWANQPDHLILEDEDHFETDFYSTDLDEALALRDTKKIVDY